MVFMLSQVFWGVFVSAFVVLFCVDLACTAEGDIILNLANIGDNIALGCSRTDGLYDNYKWWYRNGTLLANWEGFFINDSRVIQGNTDDGYADSNKIYISNMIFSDSATFQCFGYNNDTLQSYDLRVIRCSNCITTSHLNPNKMKVICTLDNFWTRQTRSQNINFNGEIYRRALFQENTLSFSIYVNFLNRLHSEFYLQIGTESRITCMLSTQPKPTSSPMTTLLTTSLKQTTQTRPSTVSYTPSKKLPVDRPTSISTTKHHTPRNKNGDSDKRSTTLLTTSLKQTTQTRPSTFPYTASRKLPVGRPSSISTTKLRTHKSKNANSDKNTSDGTVTMIVIILGSAIILILIVIIIVLRRKQMRDRHENKNIRNASIKRKHREVCCESVEDGPRKGPEFAHSIKELRGSSLDQRRADHPENGEMIDDILYFSADKIDDSSISRIKGPLNNALYTMPDKRAVIGREPQSTSKVTDRSSNSDHLYGNSVIITQHEQSRDAFQQGDQYENVKMPGSGGGAEEIPLYDMPDKGLMRNTLKATPKAGQTPTLSKDEVVSVDALYAEVDKTKKKTTNK